MGVAREKMGKDGEEEEVSSSTYNHPWGKSGRLKGKKKKASTTSCVCVVVAAVQQVIELCAFKKKKHIGRRQQQKNKQFGPTSDSQNANEKRAGD